MATLIITSDGFQGQVILLKLGVNRLGRSPKCDFQIDHATVSAQHCEIILGDEGVTVRDHSSTNGTFIAGKRIQEARLYTGQTLCLGDVELFVETTDVTIAIPKFDLPHPAPPVVLTDGSLLCPRHPGARATYQCTHCREVLCNRCVHRMRRRAGKLHLLCPLCSHACQPLGPTPRKKKSLIGFLRKTVKLPVISNFKGRKHDQ